MPQVLLPSRDEIIKLAQDGPGLLANAQAYDPALASRLQGEALVESKTLWGSGLTLVIAYVATQYGLNWDPQFCALLAGGLSLVVHGIIHWLGNRPMLRPDGKSDAPLVSSKP